MKIAFFAPLKPLSHPHPSGDQVIAKDLFAFFQDNGHEVEVLSEFRTRWMQKSLSKMVRAGVEVGPTMKKALNFNPDVFFTYHLYYKAPDPLFPLLSYYLQKPYFVYEGMYAPNRKAENPMGYYLSRWGLNRARHIFSDKTKDFDVLTNFFPSEKVSYIPPSIDTNRFCPKVDKRNEVRNRFNIEENTPVITSIAMLRSDRKAPGIQFLIDCLGELRKQGHNFYYIHVGGGEEFEKTQKLALEKLQIQFHLTGSINRDDAIQYLQGSDIFAFPGIDEGFGLVYVEAQACGLPVVAFNNGGVPDAVGKKSGFLTEPFNKKDYMNSLKALLTNEKTRTSMSKSARHYAVNHHERSLNYKKILTTMEQAQTIESQKLASFAPSLRKISNLLNSSSWYLRK